MESRKMKHHLTCLKSATLRARLWGPNSSGVNTPISLPTASSALTTCPQSVPPYWNKYYSRSRTTRALCSSPASGRIAPRGALWLAWRAPTAGGSSRLSPTDGPTPWTWCTGWMVRRTWSHSRMWTWPTRSGRTSHFTFMGKTQICLWAAAWSTASSWTSPSMNAFRPMGVECMWQRDRFVRTTSG